MRGWLGVLALISVLGVIASIGISYGLANLIASLTEHKSITLWVVVISLISVAVKLAIAPTSELISTRFSIRVKDQFRAQLLEHNFRTSGATASDLVLIATRGLDSLDDYFGKFLPQFVSTFLVTPILIGVFLWVDPLSGLILIVTLPLIPLFMIFIGRATSLEQERQLDSTFSLSAHFQEVISGLSTIKMFRRVDYQSGVIGALSERLRVRTMKVLRISFLSGFALELTASLSVAMVAVTIGFRLIDGTVTLLVALFVLILIPEGYLPLRMIGATYHASSEGIASANRILNFLDERDSAELGTFQFEKGLEVWLGSSGSGKTQALEARVFSVEMQGIAWMPQQATLIPGTIRTNITLGSKVNQGAFTWAIKNAEILDFDLETQIQENESGISGGEAQRICLARALYRMKSKSLEILLLDEPTSQLPSEMATRVWENLKAISKGTAVVVVTHQREFEKLADRVVNFAK